MASTGQLASAARGSVAFTAALKLADWVGSGREVTKRGVPKPAAAVELCDLLGIEPHSRKPRSALDIAPLMTVWSVAVVADLIEQVGDRVRVGPGLRVWREGRPEEVLEAWVRCAQELLTPPDDMEEDDLARLAALVVLHEAEDAVTLDDLRLAIAEFFGDAGLDCSCPDCTSPEALRYADESGSGRPPAWQVAGLLSEFGIAALRGDEVTPTLLGRWFTALVFRDGAPSPDLDAATLIAAVNGLPHRLKLVMSRPWLSARTPAAAARDLLAAAEHTSGGLRLTALALLDECGPEAEPAWREWATKDGFGAYARSWLSQRSGTALAEADKAWLTVDALITTLDELPPELPEEVVAEAVHAQIGTGVSEALPRLAASDHPDAPRLVALLTDPGTPRPRPDRAGVGYELEIRLRYVENPPVWRRLRVPAELTLGELHHVVQVAMGWDNSHMHAFEHRTGRYGTSDRDLGFRDEHAVTVSQLLAKVGDKILYTYDFGDDWEHDITLKKIVPSSDIACTAGEGACPPEDCGGPGGYENLKAAVTDPTAQDHADLLEWLGLDSGDDFDPTTFSPETTTQALNRTRH
ncbi:pRiA4b ORF-3-like protein [Saccharothrix variisporea]|uniref:PRiA4b ORF-3-like protein n=2 Tax=Saccharothrix variisporea TaxID=543527 RepID=A0A495XDD8_9PSEU|nr:pRiA4b ORF-3-like protein [Saccharothrix variisporea]